MFQILVLVVGAAAIIKIAVAYSNSKNVSLVGNANPGSDTGYAGQAESNDTSINNGLIAISAGLAIGITGLGSALGLGTAASAAAAAITERPEAFGKLLVMLALIEAIAIYGFVIAFVLSGKF